MVRFETLPGHQAQVDFAHFCLPWGRRDALVLVLGYSRLMWLRFFKRQEMRSLFEGLEQAFCLPRRGGGRKCSLTRCVRSSWLTTGWKAAPPVENAELFRFAYHWRFRVRACGP